MRTIADHLANHVNGVEYNRLACRLTLAPTGCWEWTGARLASGYGSLRWRGRTTVTHRVVYELLRGPIPPGLQIDHLCRNRACSNPWHLEAVTQAVNLLRGEGFSAKNAEKTHCPAGHAYTAENTYRRPSQSGGGRECRICRKANRARCYAKERAT